MQHTPAHRRVGRIDWFVVITAIVFAVGCAGGGCGGCAGLEPIPGGFPSAKRRPRTAQLRVTSHALDKIEADPATLIGGFLGGASNGVVTFSVPPSCGNSPELCCPNGQPSATCGPIAIDLVKRTADPDRLVLAPQSITPPNGRLDVTMRARVKTQMDLILSIGGTDCKVKLDTTVGTSPDMILSMQLPLQQDGTTGTTRISAANTTVTLEDADYTISPVAAADFLCFGAAFIPRSVIEDQLEGFIQDAINEQTCKPCESGAVAECGSPFANACTNKVCMKSNGQCLQELGLAGRLRGTLLFAGLSPGTTGAVDMYEVAGGYSLSNNAGVSLGVLGGLEPAGAPRDRCGPPATAPAAVDIGQSQYFQGNTRPDTMQTFDVGVGIHKSHLDQLAYAGYDGGLFCLTIGSSTVAQLSTDTIGLLSRSLGKLVESNSPMAVGLRPQRPPTIVLGTNTFKDDGSGTMVPDNPLIDLKFQALEIDFFASIDDQYNRVFTVVTDVHLPIGLQTTSMGQLTPVIGTPTDAFTNVTVKNNEAITESPAEIAGLFPTLLNLVLPQLSGGLSPISLPNLGGLALDVKAVTAVDFEQFLAIYANLVPATPTPKLVDTTAELAGIAEPPTTVARDVKQWRSARPPAVTLTLGGTAPDLEFSWRTNAGAWSGWSTNRQPTISPSVFWLPGVHKLEVRARQIGRPETLDATPVVIELALGTDVPLASDGKRVLAGAGFHGQAGDSGCSCQTGSAGSSTGALLVLVLGLLVVPRRTLRAVLREARRLGVVVWLMALASLPGCDCGNPCGDADCLPGEVELGAIGRYTSIAGDGERVVVATYDQVLGDLVVVDATDVNALKYRAVDGIPDVPATFDPKTYRGGVEDAGPNVGAWTSIALSSGLAQVAYQDRDAGALKFAYETKPDYWEHHVVDGGNAVTGLYASLVIDADQRPAIAYLALGIDDGAGHRNTELRLARATSTGPSSEGDWTTTVIASAPGFCGGMCGSQTCVEGSTATEPQTCVTPSADCTATCGDSEVCVAGSCRARLDAPTLLEPPGGTGLYVSLVVLPDGRLAAAYYDRTRRALILAAEATKGGNDFTETILDGNRVGADRGMWASATVGGDGTIHIAYQDALGDQLMYTYWNGTQGGPVVVDDGQRTGDRTHPVGAAASIYLANGEPAIAYQDGLVSDVYLATHSAAGWTTAPLAASPLLDGFSIAATSGVNAPHVAWGSMDPALAVPTTLVVTAP